MEEKIPSFFRFEDLRIYGKAIDYNRWLLSTLKDADTQSGKTLCQSFANSAMDIALNIAEGSSRNKTQFDHYLKIAKTAIRECIIYTAVAHGLGLLSDEDSEHSRELLMEQTRMIGALIISLQRGSRRSHEDEDASLASGDFVHEQADESSFESSFDELGN